MMTSWAICGYIGWVCQWRPGTLAVVQTLKETKAEELVRYVSILTENQEPFLRAHHAIKRSVALEIEWQNGSRIFGIPGGENQIRMFHPMIVVFDEMTFMERRGGLPQCREARCKANYRRQFGSPWMDGGRMHTLRLYCRLREPLQGWCKVSMEEAREKLISMRHYCFVRGVLRGTPDSQAGRDEDFRQAFRTLNRLYVERKRSLERHLNVYGRSAKQRKQSVSRAA